MNFFLLYGSAEAWLVLVELDLAQLGSPASHVRVYSTDPIVEQGATQSMLTAMGGAQESKKNTQQCLKSVHVTFSTIPLAKASHMAKLNSNREGKYILPTLERGMLKYFSKGHGCIFL